MLLAWKLNLLQLNPWVCLPEIELFIFFLPGEYEKKMHGSVVQSLSEDEDSLLWRLLSGLSIGIKLLHAGSMKTSFNARAKRDISKIPVGILRASELFSQEWLEVLTPEDNFVRRHGYSLMVTLLAVASYCQLMKATMIPGLFVLNTFEDTWKIVWLKRGCRGVECWVRKVKIKEMLANDSVGENSRHEWLEEMFMGVNGSCIQLGVAESVYLSSIMDSSLEFGTDSSDSKIDFRWDINVFNSGSSVAVES
ncbi:hypothetical protein C5167_032157 [Papaver somniferum]|uniref:Uncharacterized protein n=1 Tax=Papaver somniferum TaxID=3469 RepID=A0A4Y7K9Q2_PAPSO|nr:hypothetical protein C5167_032157 [Papaver somniferum]